MTPQQQKVQAQLDLRASELDAREKYLNTLEKTYTQLKVAIKVADETLKMRQKQCLVAAQQQEKLVKAIKSMESDYAHKTFKAGQELEEVQTDILEAKMRQSDLKKAVASYIETRDKLKDEANELRHYIKDQEDMIASAIEAGNDALLDIRSEIAGLENKKQVTAHEIEDIEHQKEQVEYSLVVIKQHYEQESKEIEEQRNRIREQLMAEQKKFGEAKVQHDMLDAKLKEQNKKLTELKISISAEHDALILERQDFETEKRRYNSARSLFDEV